MPRKKHTPEETTAKPRQFVLLVLQGPAVAERIAGTPAPDGCANN